MENQVADTGFYIINGIKHIPIKGDQKNSYKTTYMPYWFMFRVFKKILKNKKTIEEIKEGLKNMAISGGIFRSHLLMLLDLEE